MTARDDILAAVRAGLGGNAPIDADRVRQEAAALLDDPAAIRPALAPGRLADVFADRVVSPKVAASVDRIVQAVDAPVAVRRYLHTNGLPLAIALQPAPALAAFDWSGFVLHEVLAPNGPVGVGMARSAVAETGSLVFHSGADTPILASFLSAAAPPGAGARRDDRRLPRGLRERVRRQRREAAA